LFFNSIVPEWGEGELHVFHEEAGGRGCRMHWASPVGCPLMIPVMLVDVEGMGDEAPTQVSVCCGTETALHRGLSSASVTADIRLSRKWKGGSYCTRVAFERMEGVFVFVYGWMRGKRPDWLVCVGVRRLCNSLVMSWMWRAVCGLNWWLWMVVRRLWEGRIGCFSRTKGFQCHCGTFERDRTNNERNEQMSRIERSKEWYEVELWKARGSAAKHAARLDWLAEHFTGLTTKEVELLEVYHSQAYASLQVKIKTLSEELRTMKLVLQEVEA
jgi:hypothetical protein